MKGISISGIIYLIIGLVVAGNRDYLTDLGTLPHLVSALLAIILWPLVLLKVDLHIALLVR
jgi:hypothetical protein